MKRSQKHLGSLELFVLLAAVRLGDDAYAVSISREIQEHCGRRAGRASVYVALHSLENKGLVRTSMSEPRPERGGKARRTVQVTPRGRTVLVDTREALRSLWQGLELETAG